MRTGMRHQDSADLVSAEVLDRIRADSKRTLRAFDSVRARAGSSSPEEMRRALDALAPDLKATFDLVAAVLEALTPDAPRRSRTQR